MLAKVRTLVRGVLQRRRVARELDDELAFHVEMETRSNVDAGMRPAEARRIALRDLGGVEQTKQAIRDVRTTWADSVWQDVRFAVRVLAKHRLSTTITLLMLALGLGVNTAIFTAADAWLVSPYPHPNPDRLMTLEARHIQGDVGAHYRDFLDWRERNTVFEEIAIFSAGDRVLGGGADPQRVWCQVTTAGAARVLGVRPIVGRFFTAQEDMPGDRFVALVAHSAWQERFGGRPDILGTPVVLNGLPHTIIGVMPDRAALPQRTRPEFWLPLRANPAAPHGGQQYYQLIGRLKPGVTLEQARANMAAVALALEREDPRSNQGWRVIVTSAQSSVRDRSAKTITLLFTVAGTLLLLVSANVAGVLLVRSALRTKELAVRAALGASRWRLVRQVLMEGVLVSVTGGGLGLWVAHGVLLAADAFLPNRGLGTLPRLEWPILVFTGGASVLIGLGFGLWPALRISNVDLGTAIKGAGMRAHGRSSRTRLLSGLVVAEVALATALLVAGGLLTKDLVSLLGVDTGLKPQGVVTFQLSSLAGRYASDEQRAAVVSRVTEQLQAAVGVDVVGAVGELPMGGSKSGGRFTIEGQSPDPTAPLPRAIFTRSSPGYFRTLGIPLLKGRDFDAGDRLGTAPVAIVSDHLARRYTSDRNAVGQRLNVYGRSYTIVGIVGSVRHDGPGYEPDSEIYLPFAQSPRMPMSFAVHGTGDRTPSMTELRQRVGAIDPELTVERLRTMDQVIQDSLSLPRLSAQVLAGFAFFGLALALTGLYGVIAYSAEQRTREIAIRVSLGATFAQILQMVLWRGVKLAAIGLAVGAPFALALSEVMKSTLAATSSRDLVVLTAVPALLVVAALAATYIPARRAAHIEPLVALRCE